MVRNGGKKASSSCVISAFLSTTSTIVLLPPLLLLAILPLNNISSNKSCHHEGDRRCLPPPVGYICLHSSKNRHYFTIIIMVELAAERWRRRSDGCTFSSQHRACDTHYCYCYYSSSSTIPSLHGSCRCSSRGDQGQDRCQESKSEWLLWEENHHGSEAGWIAGSSGQSSVGRLDQGGEKQ